MTTIKQPTIVMHSVDTSFYDMRMSNIVAKSLSAAKFRLLENTGHMSPLTHRERVAREFIDYANNINA